MKLTKILETAINEKIDLVEASKTKNVSVDTNSVLTSAKKFIKYLPEEKIPLLVQFLDEIPYNGLKRNTIKFLESLSGTEAKKYADAFKSLSNVSALNGKGYIDFKPLWDLNVEKAMGRGELYIAFMVKGAVTQGSKESFDVAVGSKQYEVKSLDSYNDKGEQTVGTIRPGAEGKASRHPYFTNPLMSLASIIHALKDPELQTAILNLGKPEKIEKILNIINNTPTTRPVSGSPIMETPGDVPISVMGGLYNAVLQLKKERTALNKDVTTSRIKVKSPTKDATYWITPDDVNDITKVAGKDKEATIKIGTIVTDETKDAKILVTDLLNHPFVKTPGDLFTDGLNKIKQSFFGDKAGLVYFLKGITYVSKDMSEFATVESSQDGYKFDLKAKYAKWPHVQNQ